MDQFSPNAVSRIRRAVRAVEATHPSLAGDRNYPILGPGEELRLFELTGDLAAFGEADAHPCDWSAAADAPSPVASGRHGAFTASSTTLKIRAVTAVAGKTGDRFWCRPIGTSDGILWLIVAAAAEGGMISGTVTADFDTNSSVPTTLDTGQTIYPNPVKSFGVVLSGMKVAAAQINGKWCIVAGGKARSIEVQFTADFTAADSQVAANVIDWREGADPDPANVGIVVENTSNRFSGESGATATAFYNPEVDDGETGTAAYYLVQPDCPSGVS